MVVAMGGMKGKVAAARQRQRGVVVVIK